ncbi:MAG: aminoacyl-tRNA hydrolase [Chitinivibrionales bacterium]|nr:aminoacyl-tRNA hydrolase [Chitinivibrionales bacterium]
MWRIFDIFGWKKRFPRKVDFFVFGIGNPGARFRATRHNIGFRIVDSLYASLDRQRGFRISNARLVWGVHHTGRAVMCVKPMTFVNRCGPVFKELVRKYNLDLSSCMVITDDLHLDLGTIRLRRSGSDGGHNGLKSIIGCVGKGFPRLRFGIGKVPSGMSSVDFVLGKFTAQEERSVSSAVNRVTGALGIFFDKGIEAAMSRYNS